MSENDPARFELLPGDAALVVSVLERLAALAMARPGLALTAEQRLFLADTPSARDPHQMADRVERLQDVGGGELLTTTEEAA